MTDRSTTPSRSRVRAERRGPRNIEPGKSATLKVDITKPGTYEFYCPIDGHKQQGMKGEIKVGS
jgi:uncharacterized cupredoxin-like copper-binding protein